jgi:hypothetical protein
LALVAVLLVALGDAGWETPLMLQVVDQAPPRGVNVGPVSRPYAKLLFKLKVTSEEHRLGEGVTGGCSSCKPDAVKPRIFPATGMLESAVFPPGFAIPVAKGSCAMEEEEHESANLL